MNSLQETGITSEIILSKAQFNAANMKLGKPEKVVFDQVINANGYIVASPSGLAEVSSLIPGRVTAIFINEGSRVKKGQKLFFLESNELIILQQEYADAYFQLKTKDADYKRLKALSKERIITEKELLKAEGDFKSMQANVESLKARLQLIQIDPNELEQGRIVTGTAIRAPINGYVTKLEINIGQFVEPMKILIRIVDTDQLQLKINVFEKDIPSLSVGQALVYHDPFNDNRSFKASLSHIGKSIDPETKTITCIAELEEADKSGFVNNLYVETKLITCTREVHAISDHALMLENSHYFVLLLKEEKEGKMIFEKMPIQVGVIQKDYAEILDLNLNNILIEGVYNLNTEE
jgi:cobalt-zinc-cadmium efflux system membrane fusion protein